MTKLAEIGVAAESEWTWISALSLPLPLVLVSMTEQFLPGMAILRSSGYGTPARPIILITTSLASLGVVSFGGITIVIAAIMVALCTGKDAHEDPKKRYVAGIANGVFYLVGGRALLGGAIGGSLAGAMKEGDHREASVITFWATASGMTFWGLGSAFWGVVIGSAAYLLLHKPWSPPAQARL